MLFPAWRTLGIEMLVDDLLYPAHHIFGADVVGIDSVAALTQLGQVGDGIGNLLQGYRGQMAALLKALVRL